MSCLGMAIVAELKNLNRDLYDIFIKLPNFGKDHHSGPFSSLEVVKEFPLTLLNDDKLYEGEWKLCGKKIHGWGIMIKNKNRAIYSGWFKDGQALGYGRIVYENGTVYTGDFFQGWPSGNGICTYADGAKYSG